MNCINALPQLLRCDSTVPRNFLKIRTVGTKSNRSGIGARVIVTTRTDVNQTAPLRQIDEVRSGGSYFSQNDMRLHFGLDRAEKVDLVEILWPSGTRDVLRNLPVNRLYVVEEGGRILQTTAIGGAVNGSDLNKKA